MRVTHVITDLRTCGAQMMLSRLIPRLEGRGVESTVVALGAVGPEFEALPGAREIHRVGMPAARPSVGALMRLRRILAASRADVIHTWLYHADLAGGVAALPRVAPVVWGLHHTPGSSERLKPHTRAVIRLNSLLSSVLPAEIVCCAHACRSAHEALGYASRKMRVIPNGFDTHVFRPDPASRASVRRELGVAEETRLIGLMARFHPQKDHRTFIASAARVLARREDVHLVLAGGGIDSTNAELQSWIDATGRTDRFHLLGRRDDMPRLMASFDIVSSSAAYGEGLPLVLGEAMSCGVPCVTTDVGDSSRLVAGTGRVVRPRDPVALADAWCALLALSPDAWSDLGQRARARIVEHYPIAAYVAEHVALYEAVRRSESSVPRVAPSSGSVVGRAQPLD